MITMLDEEKRNTVHAIYEALTKGDTNVLVSYFADDAVLTWGPFKFEGMKKILQWAEEFGRMFKNANFKEVRLDIQGDRTTHMFAIRTDFPDGRIGELQCSGTYDFQGGSVTHFEIVIQKGYVFVTTDVAKRLGLRKT